MAITYKPIQVSLSKKKLKTLSYGRGVTLSHKDLIGTSHTLYVNPRLHKKLTKRREKGVGARFSLSKAELQGSGLWDWVTWVAWTCVSILSVMFLGIDLVPFLKLGASLVNSLINGDYAKIVDEFYKAGKKIFVNQTWKAVEKLYNSSPLSSTVNLIPGAKKLLETVIRNYAVETFDWISKQLGVHDGKETLEVMKDALDESPEKLNQLPYEWATELEERGFWYEGSWTDPKNIEIRWAQTGISENDLWEIWVAFTDQTAREEDIKQFIRRDTREIRLIIKKHGKEWKVAGESTDKGFVYYPKGTGRVLEDTGYQKPDAEEAPSPSTTTKKKTKKETKTTKKKTCPTWIQHVKAYQKEHNVSYKEAMIQAKHTYKK